MWEVTKKNKKPHRTPPPSFTSGGGGGIKFRAVSGPADKMSAAYRLPTKYLHYSSMALLLVVMALLVGGSSASCPASPNQCSCEINQEGRQIINCRRRGLLEVPTWTNSTIPFHELTLAHNDITALGDSVFNGLIIKRLDLSENPIVTIDVGAFKGLEGNLEELVLHVVSVRAFPKEALARLVNLRLLTIKGLNITVLPNNAMQTLTELQHLTLENCGLLEVNQNDLYYFRDRLQTLALPFNLLQEVPTLAIHQLTGLLHLDLQHNKLKVISTGFTSPIYPTVETIDFSNNEINTIRPNAFSDLRGSLRTLVLKSNKLTDNQLAPLGVLAKLENLNLAINSIRSVHPTTLTEMHGLKTLNLRSNKIAHLTNEPLDPVRNSLVKLEISYNEIISIEAGFFQGFGQLEELHLDNQAYPLNDLLTETTFQGLEVVLKRLYMSNTGFASNNFLSIKSLGKLTSLSLSDNNIQEIPSMSFQHMSSLVNLGLSNNSLSGLSQRALYGMQRSLETIDLANNRLESIPECAFYEYDTIKRIKLGKNPLRCDCDLIWLRKWIKKFENTIEWYLIDWECTNPPGLASRKFKDITIQEMCDITPPDARCEAILVSTTLPPTPSGGPTPPPSGSSTTSSPSTLRINATEITPDSVLLTWRVEDPSITHFSIETTNKQGDQQPPHAFVEGNVREHRLKDLLPATNYLTCITSLYEVSSLDTKACTSFQTMEKVDEVIEPGPNVGVIVGAVLGALALLALLIILGFLVVRSRSDGDTWLSKLGFGKGPGDTTKKSRTPTGIPQMGYNSRRFSRPRGATASTTSSQLQNNQNMELEKKLAGMSDEERDRILNILTTTGGSTASIISTGSSTRYVPELPPRPQSMEGYLNPQKVKDELDDPDYHIYSEIPAATGGYEIPRQSTRDSGFSTASGKYEPYPDPNSRPPSGDCYI